MNITIVEYRKWISWGVAGLLIAAIAAMLLGPVIDGHAGYDAELQRDGRVLERLLVIDRSREQILETAEQYESGDLEDWVYSDRLPASRIALDVQKRLTEILDLHGAAVQTVSTLNRRDDGYSGAGVNAVFSGSLETVVAVLNEIETSRPLLIIEDIDIIPQPQRRLRRTRGPANQSAQEDSDPHTVRVQLSVLAYTPEIARDEP